VWDVALWVGDADVDIRCLAEHVECDVFELHRSVRVSPQGVWCLFPAVAVWPPRSYCAAGLTAGVVPCGVGAHSVVGLVKENPPQRCR
jgi:hypothetical protein